MSWSVPVRLLVCVGGDCRRGKGYEKLVALARTTDGATTVPCQGVCKGPVVGVEGPGTLRWYRKVRGDRRRAIAHLARTGARPKGLGKSEVRKRRNLLKHPGRRRPLSQR